MDTSPLIWLLLALLLFWCVGLYKRLLQLRLLAQQALDALEQPLSLYGALLVQHTTPVGEAGAAPELDLWHPLLDSVGALPICSQAARTAPFAHAPLQALAELIDAISLYWERLQAQPTDLAGSPIPAELVKPWQEAEFLVRSARNHFNQRVMGYNAALREFPARLVVWLMGFKPAATL